MKPSHEAAKPKKPTSKLAYGCFALFALPFACAGLFMSFVVLRNLWTWTVVQQWVETPATLLQAEAVRRAGDDGDSYKAVARYRYVVAGRQYESDRVGIHGGADNVGDYQIEKGRLLEDRLRDNQPVPCYVDPHDPAEAILFRDLRPGLIAFKMIFATVFGAVGLGMLGAAWSDFREQGKKRRLAEQFPEEPWKWRPEWNERRIPSRNRSMLAVATALAFFWNLLSTPAFVAAVLSGEPSWWQLLLIGIFPAVGLALAAWAAKLWLRRLKWGESTLELAATPGVIGGPLAGYVRVPARVESTGAFLLRLECIKQVEKTDSDGDTSTQYQTIWEHENCITRELFDRSGDQTIIPVKFLVPYSQPPTGPEIDWRLTVAANTAGVDYHAQFDVPIFKTDASSPSIDGTPPPADSADDEAELSATLHRIGAIRLNERYDRTAIYFPPFRNRGATLGLLTVATIAGIAAYALHQGGAPTFVVAIAGGVGALCTLAGLRQLLNRSTITFGDDGLVLERGALRSSRLELTPGEIQDIRVEDSGLEVNGHKYKQVTLIGPATRKHVLAKHIRRQIDAQRLADELKRRCGLIPTSAAAPSMTLESELPDELR